MSPEKSSEIEIVSAWAASERLTLGRGAICAYGKATAPLVRYRER
jgi:hypothetical protein